MAGVELPDTTIVPVLRLALGDSVAEVTRRSTVVVPARGDPERDPPFIVSGTPMRVEYTRPGTTVSFPIGMFTSVSVDYGHAVDVRVSPHTRALTLEESLGLARELEAMVERAGWRRAVTYLPLEQVPPAVAASRHTVVGQAIGYRAQLARWSGVDGDTLTLSLRRQASAEQVTTENRMLGQHRPEVDHYLLSVDIENSAVADRYFRLAFPQVGRPRATP